LALPSWNVTVFTALEPSFDFATIVVSGNVDIRCFAAAKAASAVAESGAMVIRSSITREWSPFQNPTAAPFGKPCGGFGEEKVSPGVRSVKPGPRNVGHGVIGSLGFLEGLFGQPNSRRGDFLGADHHWVGKAVSRVAEGERHSASVHGVRVDPDLAAISAL
jgi:hypothetical protein